MSELKVGVRDVCAYLGLTEIDDVIALNIQRQLPAADKYLEGAICQNYDRDDPRAQELAVMVAADLYDNRGVISSKTEAAVRRLARDFIWQMKLEARADK